MRTVVFLVLVMGLAGLAFAKPCHDCSTENDDLAKFCKSGCGFEFGKAQDFAYVVGRAREAYQAQRWERASRLYAWLLVVRPGTVEAQDRVTECDKRISEESERSREATAAAQEDTAYQAWLEQVRRDRGPTLEDAKYLLGKGDRKGASVKVLLALAPDWRWAEGVEALRQVLGGSEPEKCCDVEGAFGSAEIGQTYREQLARQGKAACARIVFERAKAAETRGEKSTARGLYQLALKWAPGEAEATSGLERCTPRLVKMALVPGGTFTMGSPSGETERDSDEGPRHNVMISSFSMGKYEVTQGQWEAVMGTNPSNFQGPNRPVEQVSWNDAVEFCNALSRREGLAPCYSGSGSSITCNWNANGYRLPTEAEWEYACRAGTSTALCTGPLTIRGLNNGPELDPIAWYGGNSGVDDIEGHDSSGWSEKQYNHRRAGTHSVGEKEANGWGLYDMIGNVFEWCWDWYGSYSSGSQTDPRGPSSGSGRVARGGCWRDNPRYCRSATRNTGDPDGGYHDVGFRLVRRGGE